MSHIGQVRVNNGLEILTKITRTGKWDETETWVPLIDYVLNNTVECVDVPGIGKYNWTIRELMEMDEKFKSLSKFLKDKRNEPSKA